MKKVILSISIVLLSLFIIPNNIAAQCPMCKASAESSMKEGQTQAKGLNKGILYLFAAPYLIIGTIAISLYRSKRRREEEEAELQFN